MYRTQAISKTSIGRLGITAAMALAIACSPLQPGSRPLHEADDSRGLLADTLYVGPHILTMDETSESVDALAVRGETILWTGRKANWRGRADKVIELGKRALLPGFIDAHGHLTFLARTGDMVNVAPPPVGTVTSLASLTSMLRDKMHVVSPGDWLVGTGYDESLIAEQRHPTRTDLDAVSTDHPIALIHVSGHVMAVNSRALELAGITRASQDPAGGHIRRTPDGDPNGVLEEAALAPLAGLFLGGEDLASADIDRALQTLARNGITTAHDSAVSWETYDTLRTISAKYPLRLDVVVYPMGMQIHPARPSPGEIATYHHRLKVGGVKLVVDGSPQAKTAYLSEPYHKPLDGKAEDYRGYPSIDQQRLDELIAHYLSAGVPINAHTNGDAAAEMLIDAVDRATSLDRRADHRTVMVHAQTVREDQLDRMQAMGIMPSYFSAHTFFWGDWHRESVLGPERAARISPTASTERRGMPFTLHNDAPIVPPDMMRLLWATTNRITRSGRELGSEQAIPVETALRAVTINAAYQIFEEHNKGSLTTGKQADMVILSEDPTGIDPADLRDIRVLATISKGETVFDATDTPVTASPIGAY